MRLSTELAILATLAGDSAARASESFLVSPPLVDRDSGTLALYAGGISEDNTTLKPTAVHLEIDGRPGPEAELGEAFSDFAQSASQVDPRWKSPLAVGLVYLWVKDIPAGIADAMLEGVGGFFRRIPARTHVYATLYGRKRQPIPRLAASEIAVQLHDIGFLGGDRPNLADAIRLDLKALLDDESPFKVLLVITDGRDHDDDTGDNTADLFGLGTDVQNAGVHMVVLSFPTFEADAEQSAKNMSALASAGAIRRSVERPMALEVTLESFGQAIADMRRVGMRVPWVWRNLGGTHRIRLNLTTDGKERVVEVGEVALAARGRRWLAELGALLGVLAAAVCVGIFIRRRWRSGNREDDTYLVVAAAHALIGRGRPAARALVELTRSFPHCVSILATLDPSYFDDPRFPFFKTRPGRRRLEELQALLAHKTGDGSLLGNDLAEVLSQSISRRAPPSQVPSDVVARVPEDQWAAFSRMSIDTLAHALRASGKRYAVLASPRARGAALQIQIALRSQSRSDGCALAVGWLVRAAGPGRRGETLRLAADRVVLGRAPDCSLCVKDDERIAPQHAVMDQCGGGFYIEAVDGAVTVETQPVRGRTLLHDGETVEVGDTRFVFKCVSSGQA